MNITSGRTIPVWLANQVPSSESPLTKDSEAQVCIIGAGIAGLTTAYFLLQAGKSVIVVEDGAIGSGETGRTTAHLVNALDDRYFDLIKIHGPTAARLVAASHTTAIDLVEQIVRDEHINCDFQRLDGYLFLTSGEPADLLDQELSAAHKVGLKGVEKVIRPPLPELDLGPALRFPQQAQFHPIHYLQGLAESITKQGGKIFTGTHVIDVRGGEPAEVITSRGPSIRAQTVVQATNVPIIDKAGLYAKQAPYRTYVIAVHLPKGRLPPTLLWDTGRYTHEPHPVPYHYLRWQPQDDRYDLLIVGGEDHKTGQANDAEERYSRLEAWTRTYFPFVEDVAFRWSGQVAEPADGLAFIGHNPLDGNNMYIATGDSGNGMTHGTIAGRLLTDLITGQSNPWAQLYSPGRIRARAVKELTKTNLNVAKRFVGDRLKKQKIRSLEELPAEEGAVVRRGLQQVAVYKDGQGKLHERSAICTHLKCVVTWNSGEKSWDCPCHGSRFSPDGEVLNAPAITELPPL